MKFLDQAKIFVKSGDGGAGSVSFRREKYVEYGGPNGGDGGRGGDIVFVARGDLNTLIDFRYKHHFMAERGHHVMGRSRSGRAGSTMEIPVPVGTQVIDDEHGTILADFTVPGQRVVLLKGGDGNVETEK